MFSIGLESQVTYSWAILLEFGTAVSSGNGSVCFILWFKGIYYIVRLLQFTWWIIKLFFKRS